MANLGASKLVESDTVLKCPKPYIDIPSKKGGALKVVGGYTFLQCGNIFIGFITLIGGSLVNFSIPGLIGVVLDAMLAKD